MISYILNIAKIVFTAALISVSVLAQAVPPTNWDFSYKSVLEKNNVAKNELIWTWLGRYTSPSEKWFSDWHGEQIVSSILIEYPAFHAGEHTTMWLIRTNDEAFYWESIEGHEGDQNEEPIPLQEYDAIYKQVSSWGQLTPKPAKELDKDDWPGYFGFLSFHGPSGSKQMLLTIGDFTICLDKSCLPGKLKSGRLMEALETILIPESRKTYKHKSEAEIAAMTPAERIDEQILEDEYHMWEHGEKQSDLIRKYRFKDGLIGLPYLVELIDTYNPKRTRDYRDSHAVMLASDMDDRLIRLRASPEGRAVIEAIERVSARMIAAGKKYSYSELDLPKLKGLNFVDHAIADTLWVKYRIKISDTELLEFSNYLVQLDPTYPSWSERELIRDYSQTKPGESPAQVFVMKQATRFYQAYIAFKKIPSPHKHVGR